MHDQARAAGSTVGHRRLDERGFSLVEALVAVGLLAIGLVPVAYIQSSGTRNGVSSYGIATASVRAVELIEEIDNLKYADTRLAPTIDPKTGQPAFVNPPSSLSPANPLPGGYTRQWRITGATPLADSMTIDVRVTWNAYGNPNTFTLSMIKAVN